MVMSDSLFAQFDPALALASIDRIETTGITTRTPAVMPPFLDIEALAQTCGMHLRWLHDFQIQAYLLSLSDLTCPEQGPALPLTIRASLLTRTTAAARYAVTVAGGQPCTVLMGLRPSSEDTFFRTRFQCLSTLS